jgi:phosphomannomutase
MGAKISAVGESQEFVVAFEEAIGALNSTINRDKDSFGASALALEIYSKYNERNMDFVDILEKEIYHKYGYLFSKTVSYTFKELN